MKIKNWFKKRIKIIKLKNNKFRNPPKGLNVLEGKITNVVIDLINKPDSVLTISPSVENYYIKNSSTLITIGMGSVTIVSNTHHLNLPISLELASYLSYKFNKNLEYRILKIENEISLNLNNNLDDISNLIKKLK